MSIVGLAELLRRLLLLRNPEPRGVELTDAEVADLLQIELDLVPAIARAADRLGLVRVTDA